MDKHLGLVYHVAAEAMMRIAASAIAVGVHFDPSKGGQCQDINVVESNASFLFTSTSIKVTKHPCQKVSLSS
jgi:hypothetical protein